MRTVSTEHKRVDIRRNDTVKVMTGRDTGKEGRVLRVFPDEGKVLVEHVIHSIRHEHPPDRRAMLQLVVRSAIDVGRPTFYAMLIIIAALVPVFTLQSVEGRIFRPLALTYAFALLGALIFAITLVPALCALSFSPKHAELHEPAWQERLRERYRGFLTRLLGRQDYCLAYQSQAHGTPRPWLRPDINEALRQLQAAGYRDVLIEVKETNTGSLSFGVGAGSDSGLIGIISLKQRNFDILDYPDSVSEFFAGRR